MKKCIFLVVILLAGLGFCKLSYAMVMHISGAQLTRQADVVISGEVIKVEQAGRMEKVLGAQESEIYNATIKIVKIFKGEVKDPNIVVEFIKILDNVE